VLGMSLAVVFGLSCTSGSFRSPAALHELTYPPDFSYLPAKELRSTMWVLAAEIRRLDELLREPPAASTAADLRVQIAIQETLRRLALAIEDIDDPGRQSQHPDLNRNLHRFKARVEKAQRGAERTPPNYYQASALSGSCFLCHGSGDGRTAL